MPADPLSAFSRCTVPTLDGTTIVPISADRIGDLNLSHYFYVMRVEIDRNQLVQLHEVKLHARHAGRDHDQDRLLNALC